MKTFIALVLLLPSIAFADFSGRVVGVSDGDTIKVLHNGKAEKIRLNGIDCPEKAQPFGTKAKQFTSAMVFGKTVAVRVMGTDKYGRTVANVILPDGRVLNRELVAAGLAWWYQKYSKDESLSQLQLEARSSHRGLWADPNPIPPWCWRKHRRGKCASNKRAGIMSQDYNDALETQLAIEIINLFHRERLSAPQAKNLLEKVQMLIEAGQMGLFEQSH